LAICAASSSTESDGRSVVVDGSSFGSGRSFRAASIRVSTAFQLMLRTNVSMYAVAFTPKSI